MTLSTLKSWTNDVGKKNMDMNFLNFSYADAPYCYTNSHTCIYHTHTASVHPVSSAVVRCIVLHCDDVRHIR